MEKITIISTLFFSFWIIKILIVSYLDYRNKQAILKHRDQVPIDFKDIISIQDHQKAADYTLAKSDFARYNRMLDNAFLAFLLPLGGANFLMTIVGSYQMGPILSGLIFFGILGILQLLASLPFSYYYHFVLEEKFGFNKMTVKIFLIDLVKQAILGALLGGLLIAMILKIMSLSSVWWVWAWLATFAFQLLTLLLYPRVIAPIFNKFTPLDDEAYKTEVEKLAKKTKFPLKELFVMDASIRSSHGNAYFTGFGKNKRIVFFDTLLKNLTPKEVSAVLAHEIGHYHHKHILKSLIKVFFISGFFFYLLSVLQHNPEFYIGHFVYQISNYSTLFLFFTVLPIYTFLLGPIGNYFSRKNEFEADRFAKKHTNAEDMVSALVKLYKENASSLISDEIYTKFYYSHPPAKERIEALRSN